MALTPSGAISLGDINTALGRSATASISLNDSQVRFIANQDSGSVNMNAMRNKYNFNGTITVDLNQPPGYDEFGYVAGFFGSITGGPLWDGKPLDFLFSTTNYNTIIGTNTSGAPFFPNVNMRIKVGPNAAIPMTYEIGGTSYINYTQEAIFYTDLGNTVNWQFSQT